MLRKGQELRYSIAICILASEYHWLTGVIVNVFPKYAICRRDKFLQQENILATILRNSKSCLNEPYLGYGRSGVSFCCVIDEGVYKIH
jgi:hypothetical protein